MRTVLKYASILSLSAVFWCTPVRAQTDAQKETLNQIIALRADFLEYLADIQKSHIEELSLELSRVQRRLRELEDEERQRSEQVMQVEQQLATPELEERARPQIEALKTQLITEGAERLRSEQAAMARRQAELNLQIEREQQRRQSLSDKARQLSALTAN